MPIEVAIWGLGDNPEKIAFSPLANELKLEDAIVADTSILSNDLLLIGRQVATSYGKFIDVLAIDSEGILHVIELKKNRTPREVVAQLLDYASWVQKLSYQQIAELFVSKQQRAFEASFAERFGGSPPEEINLSHRLYVVASDLDASTERIINYLSETYGVPINAVFFRCFHAGDREYLTRTWLINPDHVEEKVKSAGSNNKAEAWNGQDYYFAFGENEHRNWEDAMTYGYVSAGGGEKYTRPLYNLDVGKRVFTCIPQTGYVGVGLVAGPPSDVHHFEVEVDGIMRNILDAPRKTPKLEELSLEPDFYEHFLPVTWIKALPRAEAVWEKGMFANQNIVCKLRNQFTLERLSKRFDLGED